MKFTPFNVLKKTNITNEMKFIFIELKKKKSRLTKLKKIAKSKNKNLKWYSKRIKNIDKKSAEIYNKFYEKMQQRLAIGKELNWSPSLLDWFGLDLSKEEVLFGANDTSEESKISSFANYYFGGSREALWLAYEKEKEQNERS